MARIYKKITIHGHPNADPQGHVLEHVVVAERALGKHLPKGVMVHHVDDNPKNNANANLVICQDQAYHKLLHVRARVVKLGGDPNTEKYCGDCARCRPFTCFNKGAASKSTGLQPICRECQKVRFKRWSEAA